MVAGSISVRFWLMTVAMLAFCCPAGQAWAVPQTANAAATVSGGGYRIAGTVVGKVDGRPLARARITVRDTKDSKQFQSVVTSEDGKYEFSGLPAGKYSLSGARRGFISASYDQHDQYSTAVVTGTGLATESLVLRLAPNAVIAGRVMDEINEPVRNAEVTLYYDDHSSGVDQIYNTASSQTNDLGEYEFILFRPGTYFLSVSATPWYAVHPHSGPTKSAPPQIDRSLDVAYPLTYYPDVTEADDATPIPIRGGERLQADLHLNPVPSLHLLFRLPGDGQHGYNFPQLEQPSFDGSATVLQNGGGSVVSPGVMEMTGIPAGRYNLRIHQPGSLVQMKGIDFTKDGEEIDISKSEAVSNVKISVEIPGGAALPVKLVVGLRSGNRVMTSSQAIDSKGQAELQQIPVGRYEVVVFGPGKPYSIRRISAEGAIVSGHTLNVTAGSSPSVSLTLATGSVEIQGMVGLAGKGFAGAMVVLVPVNPELDRDLFRRDQSDLDGTFSLKGVVPGSYTVLAIEDGWDLNWSQPPVISLYLKRGQKITVPGQGGRPMNIADPVEVQSK